MHVSTSLLLLFASSVLSSDVLELTDGDFQARVKDHDIILVEFFAPWCGHCKSLAPEYDTAATKLKRADTPVALAKVDCTESGKETCGKYGVSGYPTLKIFRNGEFSKDYDGPREAAGIVSYLKKQAGPSSREISDIEKMKKTLSGFDPIIVGFFTGNDADLKGSFMKTANDMRDKLTFAHTTESAIMEEYGHKDQIVLFRPQRLHSKFEPPKEVYTGSADDFYIMKFLNSKVQGIVGHRTADNQEQFSRPLCVVYYKVDYELNKKGTNYWRNRVIKTALSFRDKALSFAIANNGDFSHELQTFGVTPSDEPVATIINDAGEKFVMKENFNMVNFNNFLEEYFAGNLKPYIKSEKVPESNDGPVKNLVPDLPNGAMSRQFDYPGGTARNENFAFQTFSRGNVPISIIIGKQGTETSGELSRGLKWGNKQVVVGENFNEIVNDPTKDVLIEFYAPWCGHCKNLEPKFNELGEKLKDFKDIVIAKMDATANDSPGPFKVEGFPTLYWAPMNSKDQPEKYMGGREVPDFIDFIKRKATNPINLDGDKKNKKAKKSGKEEL